MTSDKSPSRELPVPGRVSPASRARYRLLCSMLQTYAFGLLALAAAPTLFPVPQPPLWLTVGEIALAMAFLALIFFVAPKGQ
jgi:hypothetical protein